MEITYLEGDATQPQGDGVKVIAHVVNDAGLWGKGFVLALSKRWQIPEQQYLQWFKHNLGSKPRRADVEPFELGRVQIVCVEPSTSLWVANMIAQSGVRGALNPHPLKYPALEACLRNLADWVVVGRRRNGGKFSIHMPRIGCGLAGGSWDKVERIIKDTLCQAGVPVFVYDLPNSNKV